jgi:hypothetical protein
MAQRKGYPAHEHVPKCTHNKRGGRGPCGAFAMKGTQSCFFHGGKTPKGENSNVSTYRYVKALQGLDIGKKVEEISQDPVTLDLDGEIIVVQAMIETLFEKFKDAGAEGEGIATVKAIKKVYNEIQYAAAKKDKDLANHLFEQLGEVINNAEYNFALVDEIKSTIKLKKELHDSQSRREIQLEQMMKAEDVQLLLKSLLVEIRGVIYDRIGDRRLAEDTLYEVASKFARHFGGSDSGRAIKAPIESEIS